MAPSTPGTRSATTTAPTQPAAPRRGRPPKPSAKALENRRNLRLYAKTLEPSEDDDYEEPGEPTATDQNAKLELLTRLVTDLCESLAQQQNELQEIKQQNTQLREEVRCLQGKIDNYSCSLPSTISWASVVAGQQSTEEGSNTSRTASKQSTEKEPYCLRISTNPPREDGGAAFTRYLSTQTANTHIREALRSSEQTKEVQVAGVGTTKTGYVVRFKDQESKIKAKSNTEWMEALGNGTKLVKPRFGVVVHRMPTEGLQSLENKKEAIGQIMEENDMTAKGYCIDDIAWLKNKDKPLGVSASLGIWFDTPEAAERIVHNGLVCGQRYIGSVEPYQMKKKRCHRCQGHGHLAWACKEPKRCGHCSGEHERRDCPPNSVAKCVDCNGPHPTGDKGCRVLAITNSQQ